MSSPTLSSEQLTYAAWYSKVADRVRALVAEKSSDKVGPASASLAKRTGPYGCRILEKSMKFIVFIATNKWFKVQEQVT